MLKEFTKVAVPLLAAISVIAPAYADAISDFYKDKNNDHA